MSNFITKLAMLILFMLAVTAGWAAVTMSFGVSLWNILLGLVAAFFLLRALELADKVNNLGPYAGEPEDDNRPGHRHDRRHGPALGTGNADDADDSAGDEPPAENLEN